MRKKAILITGANGEMGHGLITRLSDEGHGELLALDLREIDAELARRCRATFVGDILDRNLMKRIVSEYEVHEIYHLAALLSTRAEHTPGIAHKVNVEATLDLLQLAMEQSSWRGEAVRFLFPSSIAVYGMRDLETKARYPKVKEWEWNAPTTMYGCNKLYCENLGRYFSRYNRQLAAAPSGPTVDFRSLRFPGLVSATTIPSGGTSDYGPEMLHAAAQSEPYACFVREDTIIPFMAMPDAIDALLSLAGTPVERLTRSVYNIGSFSLTAAQFRDQVVRAFPDAQISFDPDRRRQGIVDTWPIDVDDSEARQEWGWNPQYGLERTFEEYLVPGVRAHYGSA